MWNCLLFFVFFKCFVYVTHITHSKQVPRGLFEGPVIFSMNKHRLRFIRWGSPRVVMAKHRKQQEAMRNLSLCIFGWVAIQQNKLTISRIDIRIKNDKWGLFWSLISWDLQESTNLKNHNWLKSCLISDKLFKNFVRDVRI